MRHVMQKKTETVYAHHEFSSSIADEVFPSNR